MRERLYILNLHNSSDLLILIAMMIPVFMLGLVIGNAI